MEFTFVNVLTVVALVLLLMVTGGVIYLTAVDWQDRRRRDRAKRQER